MNTAAPKKARVRPLPQFLWQRRRAKRFRPGGLEQDAFAAELADRRAARQAALSQVQGWLSTFAKASADQSAEGGLRIIGQIVGAQVFIEYPASQAAAVNERLWELLGQGKLMICHSANGARCQSPTWARVKYNGVTIEIMQAAEREILTTDRHG